MNSVGVKFNREYQEIVDDLVQAIATIEDCFVFFEMEEHEWSELKKSEQLECIRTLADDVFYGLGQNENIQVGSGHLEYNKSKHIIKVHSKDSIVHIVNLI